MKLHILLISLVVLTATGHAHAADMNALATHRDATDAAQTSLTAGQTLAEQLARQALSQISGVQGTATSALNRANSAYNYAGSAYSRAGTALWYGQDGRNRAINAQNSANSAYSRANSAYSYADSAYSRAGTALWYGQDGRIRAINAQARADDAYSRTPFTTGNTYAWRVGYGRYCPGDAVATAFISGGGIICQRFR